MTPSEQPFYDAGDLARARLSNRVLAWLPRYQTERRWNARFLQAAISFAQFCTPDIARIRQQVSQQTVSVGGGACRHPLHPSPRNIHGLYVHFHGGAWVMGNARLEDGIASAVARQCGFLVAVVDFRNAQDDRLDVTLIQSITAVEWLVDHLEELETTCVVIGGESSGAHLAAEALLHLRSVGKVGCVAGFYSMCGAFDLVGSPSLRSAKHDSLLIDGPSALNNLRRLTPSLPDRFARGPLHSDLGGLPPALFIAGALDPIVDDSIEMSEKWSRQSKPAVCVVVPEAPHGFNRFPTSLAKKANQYGRDWMKKIVASDQRPRQRRDD